MRFSPTSTVTNVMEKICIFQVVNIFICVIVDCEYESATSTRHVKIMNFNMLNFCLQKWRESLRDKLKSTPLHTPTPTDNTSKNVLLRPPLGVERSPRGSAATEARRGSVAGGTVPPLLVLFLAVWRQAAGLVLPATLGPELRGPLLNFHNY